MAAVVETENATEVQVEQDASAPLSYRGYLEKEGHIVNTGYKKRFFILIKGDDNKWTFSYYVDLGQGRLGDKRGEVELKGQVSKGELDTDFIVASKDKTFKLRANDAEEVSLWMSRIEKSILENEEATINAVINAGASYRGVLEKQGHFLNTSYKKRMFVLAKQINEKDKDLNLYTLSYYDNMGTGRLGAMKGEIVLLKDQSVSIENGLALNEFILKTKDKTYNLRGENDETVSIWKQKIQEAIDA